MASRRAATSSDVTAVHSSDGTTIAIERVGEGPALVLVDGAMCTRAQGPGKSLAPLLSEHFTVYTYDRRGRGDSGDSAPYALEREIEDLDAVIAETGGPANVFGHSSGAVLALEAAGRGLALKRLALYETPFVVDHTRTPTNDEFLEQVQAMIASDRRGAAIKRFMIEAAGAPAIIPLIMSLTPAWSRIKAIAHTLPYDITILADYQKGRPLPADRWAAVTMPTLLLVGSKSPTWIKNAVAALADTLPNAEERVLDRQTHMVKPKVTAPALTEFFTAAPLSKAVQDPTGRPAA